MNISDITIPDTLVSAHQGGWDEFLWVAVPIAIVASVVFLAYRRFKAYEAELEEESETISD